MPDQQLILWTFDYRSTWPIAQIRFLIRSISFIQR